MMNGLKKAGWGLLPGIELQGGVVGDSMSSGGGGRSEMEKNQISLHQLHENQL